MHLYIVSLIFPLPEGSTLPRAHINPRLISRGKELGYQGENPEVPSYGGIVARAKNRETAELVARVITEFVAKSPGITSESDMTPLEDMVYAAVGDDGETEVWPQMSAEDHKKWRALAETFQAS